METLKRWPGILGLITLACGLALAAAPWLAALDQRIQDQFDALRATTSTSQAQPEVILVDIDERSLSHLGPWPWPRDRHAQAMQTLRQLGVNLQLWDVLFTESRKGDTALSTQLQPDIILPQVLVTDPQVTDPPQEGLLAAPWPGLSPHCAWLPQARGYLAVAPTLQPHHTGHITPTVDPDGRVRRIPAIVCHQGNAYPALSLLPWLLAAQSGNPQAQPSGVSLQAGTLPWEPAWWLVAGNQRIPLDQHAQFAVPWSQSLPGIRAIPFDALLTPHPLGTNPSGGVPRIAIVGSTALGLGDRVNTPLHAVTPGSAVHVQVVAATQSGQRFPHRPAAAWLAPLVGLLGLAAVLAYQPRLLLGWSALLAWPLVGGVVLACMWWLPAHIGWAPPLLPVALALACAQVGRLAFAWVAERTARNRLQHQVNGLLPPALAKRLAHHLPTNTPLSITQPCVIALVDLRNFAEHAAHGVAEHAVLLDHAMLTLAESLAKPHALELQPLQPGRFALISREPTANSRATLVNTVISLHTQAQAILASTRAAQPPVAPMAMAAVISEGALVTSFIGPDRHRIIRISGEVLQAVQALLPLTLDLARPVLVTADVQPLPAYLGLTPIGSFWPEGSPRDFALSTPAQLTDEWSPSTHATPAPAPPWHNWFTRPAL
jgi:adenylate cyclase